MLKRSDHSHHQSSRPSARRIVTRATSTASKRARQRQQRPASPSHSPAAPPSRAAPSRSPRRGRRSASAPPPRREAEQPAEQHVERDPALEQPGDLGVGRAHQVEDLDRAAVGVERGARGQHHRRRRSRRSSAGPAPTASHCSDVEQPDSGASHSATSDIDRAPAPPARAAASSAGSAARAPRPRSTSIIAGTGRSASAAGAEPGLEQGGDLVVRHPPHRRHALDRARSAAAAACAWRPRRSGLGSTIWTVTRLPICPSIRSAPADSARPAAGGEHGQEHHDRDHPGHRPGQPAFREQPPVAARRTCAPPSWRTVTRSAPAAADCAARRSDRRSGRGRAGSSPRAGPRSADADRGWRRPRSCRACSGESNRWISRLAISGSTLPVGSSATSNSGRAITARAIATRCCSPPDKVAGPRAGAVGRGRPRRASRCTGASRSSSSTPATRSGSATLSKADRCGTSRKSWNTTPIRRRKPGRRLRGMVTMSSPNNLISPRLGRCAR